MALSRPCTDDEPADPRDRTGGEESTRAWPAIDTSLLDDGRGAVPPFPIDLIPQPWRDWTADRARGAGAPVDYAVQALLAAVSGVCGAGVEVQITPEWSEPLVLWQALIGASSSGKSPVLERVRGVLASIEARLRRSEGEREGGSARIVVGNPSIRAIAQAVAGNPRGVLLWRDHPSSWLAELGRSADDCAHWRQAWSARGVTLEDRSEPPLQLDRLAVSVLCTIEPDLLAQLGSADQGLAARFLYAWPDPAPFCPFRERRKSNADESVRMLLLIEEQARRSAGPLVLSFEASGLDRFERFLEGFHRETRDAEGLDGAWAGKGPGTVARLAAALELLGWSGGPATPPSGSDRARRGRGGGRAVARLLPAACHRRVQSRRPDGSRAPRTPYPALAQDGKPDGSVRRGGEMRRLGANGECRPDRRGAGSTGSRRGRASGSRRHLAQGTPGRTLGG
jgi:hypothetical protein